MATVFNNIDRVAGNPLESVVVKITRIWDNSVSPVATVEDSDTMIRSSYGTETDALGNWEVDLVSNDEITPEDSVYKVTERISSDTTTYYISVPDSATPTSWVGDLIIATPDWI